MLDYENSVNPFQERKDTIRNWRKYASTDISGTNDIINIAQKLHAKGIKSKDALHVACATVLNCDYFITTDLGLIKKLLNFEPVKVVNPVDFISLIKNL